MLNPIKRTVLAVYGLALAFVFIWVPWHGYEGAKDKVGATMLGYGLVWSPPQHPPDVQSGQYTISYPISSFAYKAATVDYGRVFLELAALSGLLLVVWMLIPTGAGTAER